MSEPTRRMRRALALENRLWPTSLVEVHKDRWPAGGNVPGCDRVRVFRSATLLVQVFEYPGGVTRLTVSRTNFEDGLTWDELQDAKREIGMGERFAVEIYPEDSEVVNVANMRHLWVLPEPLTGFGWRRFPKETGGR